MIGPGMCKRWTTRVHQDMRGYGLRTVDSRFNDIMVYGSDTHSLVGAVETDVEVGSCGQCWDKRRWTTWQLVDGFRGECQLLSTRLLSELPGYWQCEFEGCGYHVVTKCLLAPAICLFLRLDDLLRLPYAWCIGSCGRQEMCQLNWYMPAFSPADGGACSVCNK